LNVYHCRKHSIAVTAFIFSLRYSNVINEQFPWHSHWYVISKQAAVLVSHSHLFKVTSKQVTILVSHSHLVYTLLFSPHLLYKVLSCYFINKHWFCSWLGRDFTSAVRLSWDHSIRLANTNHLKFLESFLPWLIFEQLHHIWYHFPQPFALPLLLDFPGCQFLIEAKTLFFKRFLAYNIIQVTWLIKHVFWFQNLDSSIDFICPIRSCIEVNCDCSQFAFTSLVVVLNEDLLKVL